MNAAKEVQKFTRSLLTRKTHRPKTRTPAARGEPPAAITGGLAASILVSEDGAGAIVGPTAAAASYNGPYGRFLELGGRHAARHGYMRWVEDGRARKARSLKKTPRPYLKPGLDAAVSSGAVYSAFYTAWLRAQMEAF